MHGWRVTGRLELQHFTSALFPGIFAVGFDRYAGDRHAVLSIFSKDQPLVKRYCIRCGCGVCCRTIVYLAGFLRAERLGASLLIADLFYHLYDRLLVIFKKAARGTRIKPFVFIIISINFIGD